MRASSTLASTDRADGRSTAAVTVRVATSIIPVSSTRPGTPASSSTSTSSGVESMCISSPGAAAGSWPNMPSGRPASDRRVDADPVVCLPRDKAANNRYDVRCGGRTAVLSLAARICPVRQITNAAVFDDSSAASAIACRIAATTCGSARPKGAARVTAL